MVIRRTRNRRAGRRRTRRAGKRRTRRAGKRRTRRGGLTVGEKALGLTALTGLPGIAYYGYEKEKKKGGRRRRSHRAGYSRSRLRPRAYPKSRYGLSGGKRRSRRR